MPRPPAVTKAPIARSSPGRQHDFRAPHAPMRSFESDVRASVAVVTDTRLPEALTPKVWVIEWFRCVCLHQRADIFCTGEGLQDPFNEGLRVWMTAGLKGVEESSSGPTEGRQQDSLPLRQGVPGALQRCPNSHTPPAPSLRFLGR